MPLWRAEMAKNQYMEFNKVGGIIGKTEIWNVLSKSSGFIIGQIKWYGPWRQYCFFPSPFSVFNPECLSHIINFIKELMAARKKVKV